MVDKWLDCFAQWDTGNQMVFSVIALIAFLIVLVLVGIWATGFFRVALDGLVVCVRGHAPEVKPAGDVAPPPSPAAANHGDLNALLRQILAQSPAAAPRRRTRPLDPLRCLDWRDEREALAEELRRRDELEAEQAALAEELRRPARADEGDTHAANGTGSDQAPSGRDGDGRATE